MLTKLGKLDMHRLVQEVDGLFIEQYGMNLRDAKIYRHHLDDAYASQDGNIQKIVDLLAKSRGLTPLEA